MESQLCRSFEAINQLKHVIESFQLQSTDETQQRKLAQFILEELRKSSFVKESGKQELAHLRKELDLQKQTCLNQA